MENADEYDGLEEFTEKPSTESTKSPTPVEPENDDAIPEADEYTVIIDIGEGTTKVGYAGDKKPRTFPTVVGKPKYKQMMAGVQAQDIYVGDDTIRMRGVLKMDYPINRGNVMEWDQYYAILNHIFYNVLRVDSKKCNIIYLVPPLTPPDISVYFARVLFETHQVKSVAILDSATTAVFSVGETTALSVELGTGLTHVTPVMNGQLYNPSIQRLNLAGHDIEEYLSSLLTQYGIFQKREITKEIKETACKIVMDINQGSQDPSNAFDFVLPDGETMKINAYVATYPGEILFQPNLLGVPVQNLPEAIINSLRMVDPYYWRPLLKKIIFSGGTSFFKGLQPRLKLEIEQLLPTLGALPEPIEEPEPEKSSPSELSRPFEVKPEKKLVQITAKNQKKENCSKCGELIDPSESAFCPFCGAKIEEKQIDILGATKATYPKECPKCHEKLDGESAFCGFCGAKLNPILVDDKLNRKEKKLIKKTAADDDALDEISKDVESEYGDDEDFEIPEIPSPAKPKEAPNKNEVIQILAAEDRQIASFIGAAILGTLPSFKQFMADYNQYQADPNSVLVEFAKVVNPQ